MFVSAAPADDSARSVRSDRRIDRRRSSSRSPSPSPRPRRIAARAYSPGRFRRSGSRSRSRSRERRVYRRRAFRPRSPSDSSSEERPKGFANRTIRSRSPIRRGRKSESSSEPPEYPYHPNEAVVITNDVTSVSYIMDGRCSVPGDGKLHKVTIAILPFTAMIHHVITPRVSFDAYLQVGSSNSSLVSAVSPISSVVSVQSRTTATIPSSLASSPRSWMTNMSPRPPYLRSEQGIPSVAPLASTQPSK